MSEESFHVVLRDDDDRLRRHEFFSDAEAEAKRLALADGKRCFFILKAIQSARCQTPVVVEETHDSIPF